MNTAPKKKPRLPPVQSYSPAMLAALIRGSRVPLLLKPLPYRKCINLVSRFNLLRSSMRAESHEHADLVVRASITIQIPLNTPLERSSRHVRVPVDRNTACCVLLQPHDTDFEDALSEVVPATELTGPDPLDEITATSKKTFAPSG